MKSEITTNQVYVNIGRAVINNYDGETEKALIMFEINYGAGTMYIPVPYSDYLNYFIGDLDATFDAAKKEMEYDEDEFMENIAIEANSLSDIIDYLIHANHIDMNMLENTGVFKFDTLEVPYEIVENENSSYLKLLPVEGAISGGFGFRWRGQEFNSSGTIDVLYNPENDDIELANPNESIKINSFAHLALNELHQNELINLDELITFDKLADVISDIEDWNDDINLYINGEEYTIMSEPTDMLVSTEPFDFKSEIIDYLEDTYGLDEEDFDDSEEDEEDFDEEDFDLPTEGIMVGTNNTDPKAFDKELSTIDSFIEAGQVAFYDANNALCAMGMEEIINWKKICQLVGVIVNPTYLNDYLQYAEDMGRGDDMNYYDIEQPEDIALFHNAYIEIEGEEETAE